MVKVSEKDSINFWTDKRILIIGADGNLGSRIAEQIKIFGARVVGTTRRREASVSKDRLMLDLSKPVDYQTLQHFNFAIFCAGITSIEKCEIDPAGTKSINVASTLRILEALNSLGVRTVFLSSNQVFNPKLPFPTVHDRIEPRNQYAIQKVEVEEAVLEKLKNINVLRLTKFFDVDSRLISNWTEQLKCSQPIEAFKDVCVSFVYISEIINGLEKSLLLPDNRLLQLGGIVEETYYDFCVRYFGKRGLPPNKIIEKFKNFNEMEYNSLRTNIPY